MTKEEMRAAITQAAQLIQAVQAAAPPGDLAATLVEIYSGTQKALGQVDALA